MQGLINPSLLTFFRFIVGVYTIFVDYYEKLYAKAI